MPNKILELPKTIQNLLKGFSKFGKVIQHLQSQSMVYQKRAFITQYDKVYQVFDLSTHKHFLIDNYNAFTSVRLKFVILTGKFFLLLQQRQNFKITCQTKILNA